MLDVNNLLGYQSKSPQRSMIRLNNANGGSVLTKTRSWTTVVEKIGNDITYIKDSANGDTLIAVTDGIYGLMYTDGFSAIGEFSIVRNCTDQTASPDGLSVSQLLASGFTSTNNFPGCVSCTVFLKAGDKIICQTNTSTVNTDSYLRCFTMTKIID